MPANSTSIQIVIEAIDRAREVLVNSQKSIDGLNAATQASVAINQAAAQSLKTEEAALVNAATAQQQLATATQASTAAQQQTVTTAAQTVQSQQQIQAASLAAQQQQAKAATTGVGGVGPAAQTVQAVQAARTAAQVTQTSGGAASATIAALNQQISTLQQQLNRATVAVTNLRGGFGTVGTSGVNALNQIGFALVRQTVLAGGLIALLASIPTKLAFSISGQLRKGDEFNKLSDEISLTVANLNALDFEFEKSSRGTVNLAQVVRVLGIQIRQALADPLSDAASRFQTLKISQDDLRENGNDLNRFLPLVARGFDGLSTSVSKADLAQQIFGQRTGARILPSIQRLSGGFGEIRAAAEAAGIGMDKGFAQKADDLSTLMVEVGAVFRSVGNSLAQVLLPKLIELSTWAKQHGTEIKLAFEGITAAVLAMGAAFAGLKVFGVLSGIAAGAGTAISATFGTLVAGGLSTAGAAAVTTAASFAVLAAGIATLILLAKDLKEALDALKVSTEAEAGTESFKKRSANLRQEIKDRLDAAAAEGKIKKEEAEQAKRDIEEAEKPVPTGKLIPPKFAITASRFGFLGAEAAAAASALFSTKEFAVDDTKANAVALKRSQILGKEKKDKQDILALDKQDVLQSEAKIAIAQSEFDQFKSQQELLVTRQTAAFNREGSDVTIEQFAEQQRTNADVLFERSFELISLKARSKIDQLKKEVGQAAHIQALPEDQRDQRIQDDVKFKNESVKIEEERVTQQAQLISELAQKRISIEEDAISKTTAKNKELSDARIEQLRLTASAEEVIWEEHLQRIKDFEETIRNLDPEEKRLERIKFLAAEEVRVAKETAASKEAIDRALFDNRMALLDLEAAQATTRFSGNQGAIQSSLNDIALRRVEILKQEQAIAQKTIKDTENNSARIVENLQARGKELELEKQIILTREQANRQPPEAANLPQFQRSLGFQNKLDASGNIVTDQAGNAVRELQNEFAALDTFLSTSLQNTFDGLSNSITGLITGTRTWAQVWTQVGNAIIGNIVQLILEYTIFNQIRTVLDHIFFAKQRTEIGVTKGVASAARAADTAESVSQAATTASAWSPAAIFASIGSFGAAGVIGLAVVLAALGAVAAGAFSKGGRVPGTPSTEDDKIAAVSSGEVIISTPSVAKLESKVGPEGIEKLLAGEVPVVKQSATTKQVEKEKTTERETKIDSQTVRDVTAADMQRVIIERIKKTTAAAFARSGARFADGGIVDEEDYKAGTLAAIPAVVRQFESVDRSSEFVRERLGAVQPPAPKGQDEKIPIAELASKMFHVEHLRTGESSKMFLSSASDEAIKRNIVENKLELERITQTKRSEMGSSGSVDQLPPSRVVELAESVKAIELHTVTEAVKTLSEVTRHSQSDFKSVSDSVGNESLRAIELHAASEAAKTVIREVAIQSEIERQDSHFNVQDSAKVESERRERVLTSDTQTTSKASASSSAFISNTLERERDEITTIAGQRFKSGGIVRPERLSVSESESIRKSKIEEEERLARLRNTSQRLADGGIVRRNRELEKVGSAAAFQTITESSQSRANLPAEVILLSRADIDGQGAVPPAAAVVSALVSTSSVARDRIEREKAGLESKLISESIAVENTRTESTSEFAKHVSDVDKLNEIDRVRSASADAVRSISETVFNLSDKSHTDTSSRVTRTVSTSDLRAEHLSSEALRDIERVRSASTETIARMLSETVSKMSASSVESQSEKTSDVSKLSSVAADRALSERVSNTDSVLKSAELTASERSLARVERICNENTATATRALSETVSQLASSSDEVNVLKTEDDTATFSTSLLNRINERHATASTSSTITKELMRLLVETNRVTAHTRTLDASDIDRERDRERVTRIITSLLSSFVTERFASGGILRGPGGPREDRIPIWASAGEGILTASSVAYYGPQLVHALNRKELPKELLRQAAVTNVVIAAAFKANKSESKFAFGGIVARDSGEMLMADGGVIERSLVTSVKTSDQTLRTVERVNTPSFNPNINVAPAAVNVAVIDSEAKLRKFMEETGNAMAFDYTKRRKVELGVKS